MSTPLSLVLLSVLLVLTGPYAGFGVFHLIGMRPTVNAISLPAFAEYWQRLDRVMRVRMPPYALLQLAVAFTVLATLLTDHRSLPWGWSAAAVLFLVLDLVHTIKIHLPINRAIQQWNPMALPTEARAIRDRLMRAFSIRSLLMFGAFGSTVAATVQVAARMN